MGSARQPLGPGFNPGWGRASARGLLGTRGPGCTTAPGRCWHMGRVCVSSNAYFLHRVVPPVKTCFLTQCSPPAARFLSPAQAGCRGAAPSDALAAGLLRMRTALRQLPFGIYCLTSHVTIAGAQGTVRTPPKPPQAPARWRSACSHRHVPLQDVTSPSSHRTDGKHVSEIQSVPPAGRAGPGGRPSPGDTQSR